MTTTETPPERGYSATKDQLLKRLKRVEGQVRGVQGMVEEDRYCIDVLTQVSAVTRALQSVAVGLLDEHLRHCVADAVVTGGDVADQPLAGGLFALRPGVRGLPEPACTDFPSHDITTQETA